MAVPNGRLTRHLGLHPALGVGQDLSLEIMGLHKPRPKVEHALQSRKAFFLPR